MKWIAMVCLILLAACQRVQSQVTTFSELPANERGAAFIMLPYEHQQSNLEYRQYASRIASGLTAQGYRQTADITKAKYAVFIDYTVDSGTTVAGSTPLWGQTGGGTTTHTGTINTFGGYGSGTSTYSGTSYTPPTYGITGSVPYAYTLYSRGLYMGIADLTRSTPNNSYMVYQATVASSGSSGSFAKVSDCLIAALFENFRAPSGSTNEIVVPASDCVK